MHLTALTQFLQGLEENNNKAWFVMNQPSYAILREEFAGLVGEVITALAKIDPAIAGISPQKALFRIYRDVRFSKDKTPYKTTFSAALAAHGKKGQSPMYYFHLDAAGKLFYAAGCYHPAPPELARIRRAIEARPQRLLRILAQPALVAAYGGLDPADSLVRLPKGFEAKGRAEALIRLKSFVVRDEVRVKKSASATLARDIAGRFEPAIPLVRWLRETLQEAPAAE